jgi:hypothetical protein
MRNAVAAVILCALALVAGCIVAYGMDIAAKSAESTEAAAVGAFAVMSFGFGVFALALDRYVSPWLHADKRGRA